MQITWSMNQPFMRGGGAAAPVRRMAGINSDAGGNSLRKSNGTVTTFNSRKRFYTPVAIPNPSVGYSGFFYSSSAEFNNDNAISYHSSIEIAGTAYDTTTGGGSSSPLVVAPGTILAQTDPIAGLTIPANSYYYVNTFGQVNPGEFWYYTDAFRGSANGNMEEGVGLADKVMAPGTIGNATQYLPAGAVGVIGDMPAAHRLIGLVGDSISQGVGNYSHPTIPQAYGILAGLIADRPSASCIHTGRAGASANSGKSNYTKRTAFMAAAGVTDILCNLAVNDFEGAFTEAQLVASLSTLFGVFRTAIPTVKFWQTTCTPAVSSTVSPVTDASQTTRPNFADGRRNNFNTDLRSGSILSSYLQGYVEFALPAQNALDQNWWVAGYCNDSASGAMLHPNQTAGNAIVAAASATNAMGL